MNKDNLKNLFVFACLFIIIFSSQSYSQRYWNAAGKFEGSSDSYVAVAPYTTLQNLSGNFTVECWFYCEPNGGGTLFGKNGVRLLLENTTDNKVRGRLQTGSNTKLYTQYSGMETNKWYHIACTYDQSGSGSMRFYINGNLDTIRTGSSIGSIAGTDSLFIGTSVYGSFKGMIDDIRIWNRALSQTEIYKNMRNPYVGYLNGQLSNYGSGLLMSATFDFSYSGAGGGSLYFYDGYNSYLAHNVTSEYLGGSPSQTLAINNALELSGSGYASMQSNPDIELTGPVTAEAWIYPTNPASGSSQYILRKGNDYAMYLDGTGNLRFIFSAVGSSSLPIPANKWTHVAITCNASGIGTLYINGSKDRAFNFGSQPIPGTDSLYIGAASYNSQLFNGFIDAVKISNYDKSEAEIKQDIFRIVDTGNKPSPPHSAVSINFDFYNYPNTGNGAYYYLRGDAKYSSPIYDNNTPVSPVIGSLNPTFPNGYYFKSSSRRIPQSNTAGYMIDDTLDVTGSINISDLKMFIAINHDKLTDLQIILYAPSGDSVIIWNNTNGVNTSMDNIITILDDESENENLSYQYADFGPNMKPKNSLLSAFSGKNSLGKWRLKIVDLFNGGIGYLYGWGLRFNNLTDAKENIAGIVPDEFNLEQNYPNPFNPTTKIKYTIAALGTRHALSVQLKVYDILGNEVANLVNKEQLAGSYEVNFDGAKLSSGIYFYALKAGDFYQTKKMILLK